MSGDFEKDRIGAQGEIVVREWLKQQGYAILPASLIDNGGAPILESQEGEIILPNNLTWKNKEMGWVEVKTKSNATEN